MRLCALALLLSLPVLGCGPALAQPAWFTVAGDPAQAGVDTVQVDPVAVTRSVDANGVESRTLAVRVNRARQRNNWTGLPYRAYEAQVEFDCRARKAWYRSARYFMAALWQGDSHASESYEGEARPMLFRDMAPNPTERIIRAACQN